MVESLWRDTQIFEGIYLYILIVYFVSRSLYFNLLNSEVGESWVNTQYSPTSD